ncbi:MAG TPA: hypothetical protein VMT47_08590 [Polyangia bacterium]|nr:hypothetical protein [Polyangia bacterium]
MNDRRRTAELRDELHLVVSEIDDGLLALASPEAREEWASVRTQWDVTLDERKVAEEELAFVVTKVRRFGTILRDLKGRSALETIHGA